MRTLLLLIIGFALAGCASAEPRAGGPAAEVDYTCRADADCVVKDVGNCCGYYPACVNRDSPTFPERVQAECEKTGMASVCGWPVIKGCACVEGRCEAAPSGGVDGKVR
jgi:hypothetical protein